MYTLFSGLKENALYFPHILPFVLNPFFNVYWVFTFRSEEGLGYSITPDANIMGNSDSLYPLIVASI